MKETVLKVRAAKRTVLAIRRELTAAGIKAYRRYDVKRGAVLVYRARAEHLNTIIQTALMRKAAVSTSPGDMEDDAPPHQGKWFGREF